LGGIARLKGVKRYGERWQRTWEALRLGEKEGKAVWREIGALRVASNLPLAVDEPTYLLPDAERLWWVHPVKGTTLVFTYGCHSEDTITLVSIRRRVG